MTISNVFAWMLTTIPVVAIACGLVAYLDKIDRIEKKLDQLISKEKRE